MESALQQELGSLSNLEREVLTAMKEGELISENVDKAVDEQLTFGQRLSDKIADFGGSWTFILSFFFFLALWIGFNIYSLTKLIRSLSIYSAKPHSLLYRCHASTSYNDEPKPARRKRSRAKQARLSGKPKSRIGNPDDARKN